MTNPDFSKNFFELFNLPAQFGVDKDVLGEQYRRLQQDLHPDRYASVAPQQQRIAAQYSAMVNEAYATLRKPLSRALYLLELAGMSREKIAAEPVDGGFLIEQMELREKLESLGNLVDPDTVIEHLVAEIGRDIRAHQEEFAASYAAGDLDTAGSACVKMQYLEKLLQEAEAKEAELMDHD